MKITKTKALRARAEGDALIKEYASELQSKGEADANVQGGPEFSIVEDDSLLRLSNRARLGEEYRATVKQRNLEAVFIRMLASPPPSGDPGDARPSKTWINRFAEAAGEAEEDEVRERWARLLAGEVVQPGNAASYPAARFRFGLYRGAALVGVAVFSHPCNDAVLACLPGERLERTELGRFVLLDGEPANAESWMIARCFELLRNSGIVGVVSFADPEPREATDGTLVSPGHAGTIYQATNAVYVGRGAAATLHLLPDGTVLHRRALTKLRARKKGWRYVAKRLEQAGAVPLDDDEDAAAWAERWVTRLTRRRRHPGNHKYLFGLTRAARRVLPASLPYPKLHLESLFAGVA